MLRAGATFQATSPTIDRHLWIVVSDPAQDPNRALVVNLTSWSKDKDQSCVLERGEHPFLNRKTCVNYRESNITSLHKIQAALDAGWLRTGQNVSAKVLRSIRQGASVSTFIPFDNLQLLKDQLLVQ